MNEPGTGILGCAFLKVQTEKKRKTFVKIDFFAGKPYRKPRDFQPKKGFLIKTFSISERAKDGLSPHVFISISEIFTKTDFFLGGTLM